MIFNGNDYCPPDDDNFDQQAYDDWANDDCDRRKGN